jgi:putative FmdB family regulatory protein
MPIYEYRCSACEHHLEALQKMTDAPLRKCPECGKSQLKRLVSASQFRLKGSGWYETDFKSKGETKRNVLESSEAASDKTTESAAKDAGTAVAADKSESTAEKPAKSKPASAKPSVAVRKPASAKSASAARKPAAKPRATARG